MGAHPPLRLQTVVDLVLRPNNFFRYSANTIRSSANALQLLRGHGATVAADATSVGGCIVAPEARRRCKIESGEGARFS